jgi:ribosome-binding protein aMBF1 (putative translation factor)
VAAHFSPERGRSGNCALCGKHSDDRLAATKDGSIKRVLICGDCYAKMTGTPNDNALFSRVMRMLD